MLGAECGERNRGVERVRAGDSQGVSAESPRHTATQGTRTRAWGRRRRLRYDMAE